MLTHGRQKYSRGNWKKGLPVTEIIDSLLRHLTSYLDQDESDFDTGEGGSGLPHVDHILVNAIFLATMARRTECDDRGTNDDEELDIGRDQAPRRTA